MSWFKKTILMFFFLVCWLSFSCGQSQSNINSLRESFLDVKTIDELWDRYGNLHNQVIPNNNKVEKWRYKISERIISIYSSQDILLHLKRDVMRDISSIMLMEFDFSGYRGGSDHWICDIDVYYIKSNSKRVLTSELEEEINRHYRNLDKVAVISNVLDISPIDEIDKLMEMSHDLISAIGNEFYFEEIGSRRQIKCGELVDGFSFVNIPVPLECGKKLFDEVDSRSGFIRMVAKALPGVVYLWFNSNESENLVETISILIYSSRFCGDFEELSKRFYRFSEE